MGKRVNDLEVGAGINSSSKEERGVALQPQGQFGASLMRFAALGEGAPFHRAAVLRVLQISPWGLLLQYLEFIIQRQALQCVDVTSEAESLILIGKLCNSRQREQVLT